MLIHARKFPWCLSALAWAVSTGGVLSQPLRVNKYVWHGYCWLCQGPVPNSCTNSRSGLAGVAFSKSHVGMDWACCWPVTGQDSHAQAFLGVSSQCRSAWLVVTKYLLPFLNTNALIKMEVKWWLKVLAFSMQVVCTLQSQWISKHWPQEFKPSPGWVLVLK